jgi:4-hydroxy-tetrahydrodipicolinate synthase
VAIKDSSGDLPHMIRMIAAVRPNRPDFSFLTGWDAALMPMLLMGCDGGTNATAGIVPEVTRQLYDLTLTGRLDEARAVQFKLVALFDAMVYSADFPEGIRAALRLRGFDTGAGRQPLSTDQQIDLAVLSNTLQCLLAEQGFGDQPIGGCPSPAGSSIDAAEVGRIVESVVAEVVRRMSR